MKSSASRACSLLVLSAAVFFACERQSRPMGGVDERESASAPAFDAEASVWAVPGPVHVAALIPKEGGAPDGKALFEAQCAACHQATGQGIPGAFPPLAGSEWVTGSKEHMASILLYGLKGPIEVKGMTYNSVMTPFKDVLSDEELAAVATYVRSSWGNDASEVSAELFAQQRERWGDRGQLEASELKDSGAEAS